VLDSHQLPPLHPDIRASGYLNIELCHYPITLKIQSQGEREFMHVSLAGRDLCPGVLTKGMPLCQSDGIQSILMVKCFLDVGLRYGSWSPLR
jgi:hypothetical protein